MDVRNGNQTPNRWATGLRMATVVVVLGTLAAAWHPTKMHVSTAPHEATAASSGTAAAAPGPDMSVYFPDRFPAPTGNADEPQPPTF